MAALTDNHLALTPANTTGALRSTKFIERLADAHRRDAMRDAWQGYLGQLPPVLRTDPGEVDLNVNTNRIAPIVDTGVAWLFGHALGIEVDPDQPLFALPGEDGGPDDPDAALDRADDAEADEAIGNLADAALAASAPEARNPKLDAAQDYLNGCWGDEDERMTTLAKLAMNGALCGHFFAKILPPDQQAGRQFPRLVVLDPQTVTMQTDPEDCESVTAYHITYEAETPEGAVLQKRQVIARKDNGPGTRDDAWTITNYARSGNGGDWLPLGEPQIWPHPWPPIVDGPNLPQPNQRWGLPDITPNLLGLNKALNLVASNINAIGYHHGNPWIFASGTDADIVSISPGRVISIPHPDGRLDAITAHGDIAGLMNFEADLRSDMDEQSRVPSVATGRLSELPRGQQSGVTIRLLHTSLIFQTMFKQRTYGKFVREANSRMLALGGQGDGTDLGGVRTLLHWQDPLPVDDLQQAQAAFQWSQIGVSSDTLMSKGGFDPEVERRKNAAADARQLTDFAQGQGMPPEQPAQPILPAQEAAPTAPAPPTDVTQAQAQPVQPAQAATPPKKRSNRKPPPVNHPAAQAMRDAVSQAAKTRRGG